MHAALLYELVGEADGDSVESYLSRGFPAVDANATHYLDGRTLYFGDATAKVEVEDRVPVPDEEGIHKEKQIHRETHYTEWYADLEGGWAGISTSDGEFFLGMLQAEHGVVAEPQDVVLDAWVDHLAEQEGAGCWGMSYADDGDDGGAPRAGAGFHADAGVRKLPTEGNSAVGFRYRWNGMPVRGMLAKSGYLAVYNSWTEEQFARFVADEVWPYTTFDADSVDLDNFRRADPSSETAVADGGDDQQSLDDLETVNDPSGGEN